MTAPTDLTDAVLADRIRDTCTARAASVALADRPFDADRPSRGLADVQIDDLVARAGDAIGPRPPRSRGVAFAIAAVLVLLVGLVAVLVASQGPDSSRTITTGPSETTTTVPMEMGLGDGSVNVALAHPPLGLPLDEIASAVSAPEGSSERTQLFGVPGGRGSKVLVEIGAVESRGGTDTVTVRGRSGLIGAPPSLGGDLVTLDWSQAMHVGSPPTAVVDLINTTSVGLTRDQVRAFLDSLAWRTSGPEDGFADPNGEMVLLGESGPPVGDTTNVVTTYRDRTGPARPSEASITVRSTTSTSDGPTPAYLWTWLMGEPVGDGPVGRVQSYDHRHSTMRVGVAGGLDVVIAAEGQVVDKATLESLVADLGIAGPREVDAFDQQVQARLRKLPLLSSRKVGDLATVEVRGSTWKPSTCLVIDGARRCGAPGDHEHSWVSVLVDGTWYVAAVVADEPTIEPARYQPSQPIDSVVEHLSMPEEDRWAIVAAVPKEITAITIWQDGFGFDPQRPAF